MLLPPLRLEQVDLRAYWASESADFTPWLAEGENLTLLAETLGFSELELEDVEVNVGPFRADLLCRPVGSADFVLVENQLERTDHRHLGQIITYAAGLDAGFIVWISPQFTEEHRSALDWLNRVTGEDQHFFGVQVELWRIGDSAMAPRFHLVVRPNAWEKSVRAVSRAGSSERSEVLRQFWDDLRDDLEQHGQPFELPSGETSQAVGSTSLTAKRATSSESRTQRAETARPSG